MLRKIIQKNYDVVIAGGGMAGVCAALASARQGAKTCLVQNRSVLGGNASPEVKLHICGADFHSRRPDARETGIVEELLLKNKRINKYHSFSKFQTVLWETVTFQENLSLYLNTHLIDAVVEDKTIKTIIAEQLTSETRFEISGKIFVDCTGDGTLGYLSGAEYMTGREGKNIYGEKYAPDENDNYIMGSTLMFKTIDTGEPVKFEKPSWANSYTEDNFYTLDHSDLSAGYWWIELGGGELDTIYNAEEIRDKLIKALYGVWDHIKNTEHGAENYDLEWVQFLPGKRDSRRLVGDYILKEEDVENGKIFYDAVAYGGWPMDIHEPMGLETEKPGSRHLIQLKQVYTIPYRSLYSRNIKNLMLGGRAISVSHVAFGSIRVMATTSVAGQAIGTACAMQIEKGLLPRDILDHICELQRRLMKDDCYIPGFPYSDEDNFAKSADITCSSCAEGSKGENVVNGYSRNIDGKINSWISGDIKDEQWICLDFRNVRKISEICINFDSNLSREITIELFDKFIAKQEKGLPSNLVKDFTVQIFNKGKVVYEQALKDNYLRHNVLKINEAIVGEKIKITVLSTWGDENARIFDVRVY